MWKWGKKSSNHLATWLNTWLWLAWEVLLIIAEMGYEWRLWLQTQMSLTPCSRACFIDMLYTSSCKKNCRCPLQGRCSCKLSSIRILHLLLMHGSLQSMVKLAPTTWVTSINFLGLTRLMCEWWHFLHQIWLTKFKPVEIEPLDHVWQLWIVWERSPLTQGNVSHQIKIYTQTNLSESIHRCHWQIYSLSWD